jgi:arginine decarboxylase
VLLLNVCDVTKFQPPAPPEKLPADAHETVRSLAEVGRSLTAKNIQECYNDAVFYRDQIRSLFSQGALSLRERALAERIFWQLVVRVAEESRDKTSRPDEIEDLDNALADVYLGNFSVFQSLPDSWAIKQLFPIMPIHRLDERPTRNAVLADITCDSDGKIDHFVSLRESKRTLELHELREGEPYYLAAFLVGAYQETLGDLHNLFGDTHVVHIKLHEEGGWWIEETVKGDTAAEVLRYMRYDVDRLLPQLVRDCERAVREGRMSLAESQALRRFYDAELNGYTYLEPD